MQRPIDPTVEQDIHFLQAFSSDVIASYTLASDYDSKQVAFAIDRLFGQFGELDTSARVTHEFPEAP